MIASQIVNQTDGSTTTVSKVGTIRYVVGGGHSHWHFINLESYELRRLDGTSVGRDRKTGFCLSNLSSPSNCGADQPGLLQVSMGLPAGVGDLYHPQVEGQYIDITAVPVGDYVLVHRSNPTGTMQESTLANDAASLRIRLSKHRKKKHAATRGVDPRHLSEHRHLLKTRTGGRRGQASGAGCQARLPAATRSHTTSKAPLAVAAMLSLIRSRAVSWWPCE
jgi:Lysyl oxidase